MNVDPNQLIQVLIPLVSVILGIGMIIVSILVKHRRQMQELDNRHRERMAAIEKGLDLPPDPVVERSAAAAATSTVQRFNSSGGSRYLLRGLIWFGVGIALTASNRLLGDRTWGFLAMGVGLAYLIYYAVEGRREGPPPGGGGPAV